MLREQGAEIVSVPAVAIVDAADPAPVLAWIERFVADPADYLVLLTGEGLSRLHALAQGSGLDTDFVAALRRTTTIIRGPKPARALRALGLAPQLRAEPATTEGVIALLSGLDLPGRRVGVQLYPEAPSRLTDFLESAGALPDPVTPYAYAAAASDEALAELIETIACGAIDAVAFTSASQARRLFELAEERGAADRLLTALRRSAVAAVGPVVASELERHGVTPTIVPAGQYFMKPLVTAIAAALAG
jgi:uroporphyrinogen-III synthase